MTGTNLISRRRMLLGMGALAGMSALAACAGSSGSSGTASTPAAAPTSAPPAANTPPPTVPAQATTAVAEATKVATTAAAPSATSAPVATTGPAATTAPAASSGSSAQVSNPPTSPDQVDAIALKGKNIQVTYWHNRPQADQDLLQSMLDEFSKANPYGITARAEIAGASYNDVYNKVNAAIQAGQPPDLSVAYQNQAAFYRGAGAVIDLNPFLKSKTYGLTAEDLSDYYQAFLDSDLNPQFKNERLGFPTQRSIEVMYYNSDWLKQLGFDSAPADWTTYQQAIAKASDASKSKYGYPWKHDASDFASMVFSRGGQIINSDATAYVFNDPAGVDSATFQQQAFKNKQAVEIGPSEKFGEQNRFATGNMLTVFSTSSGLPFYQQAIDKGGKFKWDIGLLPRADKFGVDLYGASVSAYKTTPEKELAAWLVIKFLGEAPQTAKWAIATGYLPVRKSAKDTVVAAYKKDPKWGPVADSYAKMFDWFQYAEIEAPVAGYDPVRTLIDKDVMSRLMTDFTADPKQLLDAAVTKANQILKQNAPKT